MSDIQPYNVQDASAQFAVIEMFSGDNNLAHFAEEDLAEMVAGTLRAAPPAQQTVFPHARRPRPPAHPSPPRTKSVLPLQ